MQYAAAAHTNKLKLRALRTKKEDMTETKKVLPSLRTQTPDLTDTDARPDDRHTPGQDKGTADGAADPGPMTLTI